MRIGIDARWIFPELSGIGTYTQELIRHLAHHDRKNEYILFFEHRSLLSRTAEATQFNTAPNFSTHIVPYGPFTLRNQVLMPGMLSDHRVDVFHSTNYMIPFRAFPHRRNGHMRCVVTIHDLIPLLFPEHAPKSRKTRLFPLFKRIMREVGRRAHVIITVSESSRRDIIRHLRLGEEQAHRVVVVPEGVPAGYSPGSTQVGDPKTILYVGRMDPYKNVVRLVEAFARLRAEVSPNILLKIIGPEDQRYPEPRQRAVELGVENGITWSGYVASEDLKRAYQEANVLVLPSQYEGFGLPVVEAMASGTPVVCSNTSSLPEVAGDAALLVDPNSTDELVQALARVLTETRLAREMREKGIHQAGKFIWSRTAELTVEAYQQAIG